MTPETSSVPWWRVPAMWLVVGGPAVAVTAGTAAMVLALRDADPPLHPASEAAVTMTPAAQARNHAAQPAR